MGRKLKSNHERFKKENAKGIYSQFDSKNKRKQKIERESYLENLSRKLQIPDDVLVGAPVMTITGKRKFSLENYKGIIEYTDELIRIQTKSGRIQVEGCRLNIDYCTDVEMHVTGNIKTIYYC